MQTSVSLYTLLFTMSCACFYICALSWVFTLCIYFYMSFRGVSVTVVGMCFCVMVCQCISWPSPRRRLPEVLGVGTEPDRRHTARRSDWEQTCPHLPRALYKPSKSPCLASPPLASQGGWLERGHEGTKTTSAHLPHLAGTGPVLLGLPALCVVGVGQGPATWLSWALAASFSS